MAGAAIAAFPRPESTQDVNDVKLFDRVLNPREIRRRLGLNQEQFWTQIGVTQSGGSRYESGREMPKPVRELLRLVHVEQIDLSQVKRVDFEIISYLKDSHPDLYRTLRRAVKGHQRSGGPGDGGDHSIPTEELADDVDDADPIDRARVNEGVSGSVTRSD
jgi:DNA-binding transcriptional regulator YiaG